MLLALVTLRSFWVADEIHSVRSWAMFEVMSSRGRLLACWGTADASPIDVTGIPLVEHDAMRPIDLREYGAHVPTSFSAFGFEIRHGHVHDGIYRYAVVPMWFLAALSATPLVLMARRRWISVSRTRRGCCATCGYCLTGAGERCPECGSQIATRAALAKS